MALAINIIDRRGPSNEMRHQLQPKKTKAYDQGKATLAIYMQRRFSRPTLLTRRSALVLKMGVSYGWRSI